MDKLAIDTFSFYEEAFVVERLTPRTPIWIPCENIRFSSLFIAGGVSRNVPSDEERGETDVFAGYDQEVRGSSLALRVFLAQETLLHFVSVHPSVYMGTGDILLEGNLRWTSIRSRGAAILLGLLHVKESGISSGRLSLWL